MYYLAIGNPEKTAALLAKRYEVSAGVLPVIKDLYPHQPPPDSEELPQVGRPYQRLNDWRWAVPEVSTFLEGPGEDCLLLGNVPIDDDGHPWRNLAAAWAEAGLRRQLGWLAQVANLWDACVAQSVASSLLDLANVGVQGWQVRLFYLTLDSTTPTLPQLAAAWRSLTPITPALVPLLDALATGQIDTAGALASALESLAQRTPSGRVVEVTGATDVGRRRKDNEDCFTYDSAGQYAIVCDGMGGHDGGEVASRLATDSLDADCKALTTQKLAPEETRQYLTDALRRANQQILALNQQQRRNGTARMGTTVVACHLQDSLLHVAHVGDSRIYLINRAHCQQLTVDHDLTQKEISRAASTSNAAMAIPTGGTLTQALGLMPADTLQPVVRSFVLSEECLILLCSDGLCDGDLVERFWRTAFLPLIDQALVSGAPVIMNLALSELGHDNITFILLKYAPGADSADLTPRVPVVQRAETVLRVPPERPKAARSSSSWLMLGSAVLIAAVVAGLYFLGPHLAGANPPASQETSLQNGRGSRPASPPQSSSLGSGAKP